MQVCAARVKALREATPQAVHHFTFTRFDQVNQLVSASEADPDLDFMARTMALCSLPRSNPSTSSGGTSASPVSGCCETARSASVRRSSTKSSAIRCPLT